MFSPLQDHPAWYITVDVLLHLLVFAALTCIVVFVLRGPLRRYKAYDMQVFQRLQPCRTVINNKIMLALTFLGKHQFLIPANLLLMALFFFLNTSVGKGSANGHWYAFNILVVSLSSLLLMFLLKQLFHRRRPQQPLLFEAKGLSFPSGHAIMSVCFYGLLLQMLLHTSLPNVLIILLFIAGILLILLIGFSRVYLQVHYLSDVLAGFAIGSCWLYIALHIFKQLDFILG